MRAPPPRPQVVQRPGVQASRRRSILTRSPESSPPQERRLTQQRTRRMPILYIQNITDQSQIRPFAQEIGGWYAFPRSNATIDGSTHTLRLSMTVLNSCSCSIVHLKSVERRPWMRVFPWLEAYQCGNCAKVQLLRKDAVDQALVDYASRLRVHPRSHRPAPWSKAKDSTASFNKRH
jgi:hypothetical protein